MLYGLIEAERNRIKNLQKENELRTFQDRITSRNEGGQETGQSDVDVSWQYLAKESVCPRSQSRIQDSEWLGLSTQDKLAWAKASKDPRIAPGQHSPLEKEILSLGGVHTKAARRLIIQKHQEESEMLCKEQALCFDYWLAKVESFYNKKVEETVKEQQTDSETEEKTIQSVERRKWCYLVPQRELKHIARHIHRTEKARELGSKARRKLFPPISATTFPKTVPEVQGVQNPHGRQRVQEREQMQIKDHQERMVRGRKLLEQRLKERLLKINPRQPPTLEKHKEVKKWVTEFETVTVYPLFQPHPESLIKVNILVKKPQTRKEEKRATIPHQRKFLSIPPFLRSQIGNINE